MWRESIVLLATVAVGSSLYPHYVFPQVAYTNPDLHTRQGVKYDCPHEGFFTNPTNCSQYYRCVDYTGSGLYFSVFAFECHRYHVFMMDGENSTCIPGTECIGSQQTAAHVHVPSPTEKPSGTTSETVVVTIPVSGGTSTGGLRPIPVRPKPVTAAPVTSAPETTFSPIPTAPTTSPTVPPPPPAPVTPSPPPTVVSNPVSEGECHDQYVQHDMFCNVYYKCSNSGDKFVCPAGSLFDADRQMCRIQSVGEDLCGGKSIYSVSFRFVSGFNSATPQQIFQVPQSQPQYLSYFNQHPQVLNSNQQTPLHYVPSLTTQYNQECHGQYVQSDIFCNVYYKCSKPEKPYLCETVFVFDADRQMCTFQSKYGEDLCGGKSIYPTG